MSQDMWARLKSSDKNALVALIEKYEPRVRAFLRRRFFIQDADLDDLSQEYWAKIWQNRKHINPESAVPWLHVIARNTARTRFRKSCRQPEVTDPRALSRHVVNDCVRAESAGEQSACSSVAQYVGQLFDELSDFDQAIVRAMCYPVETPWPNEILNLYPKESGVTRRSSKVEKQRARRRIRTRAFRICTRIRELIECEALVEHDTTSLDVMEADNEHL